MIVMVKYLSLFSLLVVFALLLVLSRLNPHPKNLKSDTEYAKSKNYITDYDFEDVEDKNITPNLSEQRQDSNIHPVPIEAKILSKECKNNEKGSEPCR